MHSHTITTSTISFNDLFLVKLVYLVHLHLSFCTCNEREPWEHKWHKFLIFYRHSKQIHHQTTENRKISPFVQILQCQHLIHTYHKVVSPEQPFFVQAVLS